MSQIGRMDMEIFKYKLEVDTTGIAMPIGADILALQVQYGEPCIWALVDPNAPTEQRIFKVFGTGHEVPVDSESLNYIGTFQLLEGQFVGHVFELVRVV